MSRTSQIQAKCTTCKKAVTAEVKPEDLARYVAGEHIQNCFPYLSAGVREIFISGMCEDCFDNLFTGDYEAMEY